MEQIFKDIICQNPEKEELDDLKWTIGVVNIKETKPILDNLPLKPTRPRQVLVDSAKHLWKVLNEFSTISSRR